jgi:thiosulfate/3-mercaptopyruvate sulfurtransferase
MKTRSDVLVDAAWLDAHLHDPAVRVVEVDVSRRAHDEWHIEGAVLWDIYRDLKDADYRLIGTAATMSLLARSGIGPRSVVVFYGYAPALGFWLMKLHRHQDVRILDCSRDAWRNEGHPVSSRPSAAAAAGYVLPAPDPRLQAGHATVRDAIGRPGRTLLDVRSREEYQGERFWPPEASSPAGGPAMSLQRSTSRSMACTTTEGRSGTPQPCAASSVPSISTAPTN